MKINPHPDIPVPDWPSWEKQEITMGGFKYSVPEIIEEVEIQKLKPFELQLQGMSLNYRAPCSDSIRDFMAHVIAVNRADFKHPIVLAPDGVIMDGRHRVIKAILVGKKSIMAVQLKDWPEGKEVREKGPDEY